jgi:hypothetical protein
MTIGTASPLRYTWKREIMVDDIFSRPSRTPVSPISQERSVEGGCKAGLVVAGFIKKMEVACE